VLAAGWLAVFMLSAVSVVRTDYPRVLQQDLYPRGLWEGLVRGGGFALQELGELAANLPLSKAPIALHSIYPFIGAVVLSLLFVAFCLRARHLRAVEVYLVTYALVVFGWPYHDARFWLPTLPLLIGWITIALRCISQQWPIWAFVRGYVGLFSVLGLAALLYSTRITFAGQTFPERYGDGTLRPAYEVAFGKRNPSELSGINRTAFQLLEQYEPRAVNTGW